MLPKCIQNPSIIESKFIRDPFKIHTKSVPNPSKIHRKSIPNPSKIHPKSTLGCECAFGANQGGPGNEKGDPPGAKWVPFWPPFSTKKRKSRPKVAQREPKVRKKGIQKSMQKYMPKKQRKVCQKLPKYAKTDATIIVL